MAEQPKPATLQDVLNYEPETYFKKEEISLIQSTFRDERVINVLRKALLPSVGDGDLPLEEMGKDVWLLGRDYSQIPTDEVKAIVVARQEVIKFIMGGLIQLKQIASMSEDTVRSAYRREKNSMK